jgi:hypothetical protein
VETQKKAVRLVQREACLKSEEFRQDLGSREAKEAIAEKE